MEGSGDFRNTRSYGVSHSAWAGYRPAKKLLYVVNANGPINRYDNKLEVIAGLQSQEFYVSTGATTDAANNAPLSIDSYAVKLTSASSSWVQFG